MKIEMLRLKNFRCFGPRCARIPIDNNITVFVGGNGSGKTATFLALSRLFGVTATQRTVCRRDFHIPKNSQELESGTSLAIEVILGFPELEDINPDAYEDAIPEFFFHMSASAPGNPLKARMQLRATWTDDGTSDGSIEEEIRWINTLDSTYDWEDCPRVSSFERGAIQLIYVPATRDGASQVTALLKSRLWKAAKWSTPFKDKSLQGALEIQSLFESELPTTSIITPLARRWQQLHEADTYTTPILKLVETRLDDLVRKVEFSFSPDEEGRDQGLTDFSDGQRSLFHIALTAATLEIEESACRQNSDECAFEQEKLRRVHLTIVVIFGNKGAAARHVRGGSCGVNSLFHVGLVQRPVGASVPEWSLRRA